MVRLISIMCAAWLCVAPAMAAQQPKPASATSVLMLTDKDNGKTVELTNGAMLVVKLSSNASTGYSWSVQGNPPLLKLVDSKYNEPKQPAQVPGATGIQTFQWQATGPGTASLQLEYRRPWEKDQPAAKTFSITVQIR